jgi:uncharacterized protein (TIGR02466 family)
MSYNYIFPTSFWSDNQPELAKQLLPVAKEYLETYAETFMDNPNYVSTYRVREASDRLRKDIRLKPLIDYLIHTSKEYIKEQNVNLDNIKDSLENIDNVFFLINKINKTGTHFIHAHPNSIFSGCFYLNTNEDDPPLIFTDPRPYSNYVYYERRIYNQNPITTMCPEYIIQVNTGLIMLWPSWLEHYVPPSKVDSDRITIAFNIGRW